MPEGTAPEGGEGDGARGATPQSRGPNRRRRRERGQGAPTGEETSARGRGYRRIHRPGRTEVSRSSTTVRRKVAQVRWVLGAAVVAFGLMLMATGTLVLIHLALWSEPWLGTRFVLASIVPAAVMTWSGLVAFFRHSRPVGALGLSGGLSATTGASSGARIPRRTSHGAGSRTGQRGQPCTAAFVGVRKSGPGRKLLRTCSRFRWLRWRPVFRLQWMFPIFVVAVGATLGLADGAMGLRSASVSRRWWSSRCSAVADVGMATT